MPRLPDRKRLRIGCDTRASLATAKTDLPAPKISRPRASAKDSLICRDIGGILLPWCVPDGQLAVPFRVFGKRPASCRLGCNPVIYWSMAFGLPSVSAADTLSMPFGTRLSGEQAHFFVDLPT